MEHQIFRFAKTFTLCGSLATSTFTCVAGQALMALGWLWWRAWVPSSPWSQRLFLWQAWHSETSSGCFSGTFFGTLLNLTWLCTKASQTFSGTFSGTLLNLPLALRQSLPDLLRNPNLTWLCTKASHSPEPDLALHQGFLEPFPGPSPEP